MRSKLLFFWRKKKNCYLQACFDISVSQNVGSKSDNVSFICLHAVHKYDYNILSLARIIIYQPFIFIKSGTLEGPDSWDETFPQPRNAWTPGLHWPRITLLFYIFFVKGIWFSLCTFALSTLGRYFHLCPPFQCAYIMCEVVKSWEKSWNVFLKKH